MPRRNNRDAEDENFNFDRFRHNIFVDEPSTLELEKKEREERRKKEELDEQKFYGVNKFERLQKRGTKDRDPKVHIL